MTYPWPVQPITLVNAQGAAISTITPADGQSNTIASLGANTFPMAFNGTTWDRWRNNQDTAVALASLARTATTNGLDLVNYNSNGIIVFINVTIASGTGGLQVQVQARDSVLNSYSGLNSLPTAVTTVSFNTYVFYPGINSGGTAAYSTRVPKHFRIRVVHVDGTSYTYSVNYALML